QRKNRPHKPLAIIAANLETIQKFAHVSDTEMALLSSRNKPIVLLKKKTPYHLPEDLAPANKRIGVMLPYTPLHHLLLTNKKMPKLVMTSGNRSGEPICTDNTEALNNLAQIADLFLHHDRSIIVGCDDSVQGCRGENIATLRTGRGLAPSAIKIDMDCGHTLALGGNDKNAICLTRNHEAFLSQHIGNLDHLDTMQRFRQVTNHLQSLLEIKPNLLVHDLHPDYATSNYANEQTELPAIAVQHHHAHAVSCMAEHNLSGPVLALTLDGSGYGPDNTIWGGEILLARLDGYERLGFLSPTPMPGGEQAIHEPWRMAASFLYCANPDDFFAELPLPLENFREKELPTLVSMIKKGINCPLTSSCGRLFDAVAALLGLCNHATFDGQGAIALEAIANPNETGSYPPAINKSKNDTLILDSGAIIRNIILDIQKGTSHGLISARFHNSLAALFSTACHEIRTQNGLNQIVCSGGVFQNFLFTSLLTKQLEDDGFTVYTHQKTPPNDGGLALGQALAGRAMYQHKR
ncbi:MAG: carbamoyltransferase HypF, partial [Desulfobulbaceae bacterium]|nr:carbamoyltransferase HypF [Desulfobulbaceae bacterium]